MLNKKILIPLVLLTSAIFAIGYNLVYEYIPNFSNTTSNYLDSLDTLTDQSIINVADASQMFNERGFYKSNSISFDENEIINDFNGNLMYQIPLYYFKVSSSLNFDMKLVYNGSVNHEVILNDTSNYGNPSKPDANRYNFNLPEWIISINGIAVQVMNFESRFLSKPTSEGISGDDLKRLIPGYHYCDGMKIVSSGQYDRVFILAGDGSTISLINKDQNSYIGTYYDDSKGSHIKASLKWTNPNDNEQELSYRMRTLELYLGDGLLYIFYETPVSYWDLRNTNVPKPRRPTTFLLSNIRDRFGNGISINYGNPYTGWGRSFITSTYNTQFSYYPNGIIIDDMSGEIGRYKLHFSDILGSETLQGSRNPRLSVISNPANQIAEISYSGYVRNLLHVPCNYSWNGQQNLSMNNGNRIKAFSNFLGGRKEYNYVSTDIMEINYLESIIDFGILRSDNDFKGYGRDPFFTNMVSYKKVIDKGVNKSESTFGFPYDDAGDDFSEKPIDTADSYLTEISLSSLDNATVNESVSQSNVKEYRVYPVKNYGIIIQENKDLTACTKLIKDKIIKPNTSVFQETQFTYFRGDFVSSTWFNGSFELSKKINYTEGVSRTWLYDYEYKGGNDSLIKKKTEIDPLGNKTENYYRNFDTTFNFLQNDRLKTSNSGTLTYFGYRLFYLIGQDSVTRRYDNANTLLKQNTYHYIYTQNNDSGYYGQLVGLKSFAEKSTNSYIETKFTYYKLDTLAMAWHGSSGLPFIEGNSKKIIKPDGEEDRYFYYQISYSESSIPVTSGPPEVSYKIKFANGSISTEKSYWSDSRIPVRIDNYKRYSNGSCDTLKRIYTKSNSLGKPTKIINENKFLTQFVYEPQYNRIKSITLPGDFVTTATVDTVWYRDTSSYTDTLYLSSTGWGHYDAVKDTAYYFKNPCALNDQNQQIFYNKIKKSGGNEESGPLDTNISKGAYIKFANTLPPLIDIYSANFSISPTYTKMYISYLPADTSDFENILKPVAKPLSEQTNPIVYWCGGSQNQTLFTSNINIDAFPYMPINIDTTGGYQCYKIHNYNVTDLLKTFIITNNKVFDGMYLYTRAKGSLNYPPVNFETQFFRAQSCLQGNNYLIWVNNYIPKIQMFARVDNSDTLKRVSTDGATIVYYYDDDAHSVTISSIMKNTTPLDEKRVRYHFDGFGNIKRKDMYNSDFGYDSLVNKYNFLNIAGKNTDPRQNNTYLSYDFAGRLVKTKNADNSSDTTKFAYDDDLGAYFGSTYSGFVEKQTFIDETNREFNKYFDAVGNLLREEKFVAGTGGGEPVYEDNPYDPDTTFTGQDFPSNMAALTTDYRYDNLYRLVEVKTPAGRSINYYYDAYSRQSQRNTPDAGITRYSFDNNGNLILSQDANQKSKNSLLNTRRTYDGLNRLLTISDYTVNSGNPVHEGPMGDTLLPFEFDTPSAVDSIFVVNVYDTLTTAVVNIFSSNKPSDYNTAPNFTRGNLVATAYRSVLGEDWGYKFYRYDERGNIVKLWHYIAGLGWKTELYYHNSQSQLTRNWYQPNQGDGKLFTYGYDDAGRLDYVNQYVGAQPEDPEEESDSPTAYFTLTKYTYNENSQVLNHFLNSNTLSHKYTYNNRNWVTRYNIDPAGNAIFLYDLQYDTNGNIRRSVYGGSYKSNFANTANLYFKYIYDNSNRLLKTQNDDGSSSSTFNLINGYDKDGNFQGMKRYGSANNLADDFGYSYFSGTNKLQNVSNGLTNHSYTYDNNGNMLSDQLNRTGSIKYDHRNLMTEIRVIKSEAPSIFEPPVDMLYLTQYRYDEAGNRVRKVRYKYTGSEPDPVFDVSGDAPPWTLQSDEFYVRDVSGKEIAIYSGSSLTQWNIWGLDNVGKINADTTRNYYLKDHLGSIRVVLNSTNTVISAQDYDCWGYPLENRSYNSSAMKYDFTGKERDDETSYDYFGARYYDSRIGRWGQVEPLLSRYLSYSTYVYVLNNPILNYDFNGKDVYIKGDYKEDAVEELNKLSKKTGLTFSVNKYGKLSYTGTPNENNLLAQNIVNAINDKDVIVNLKTTDKNILKIDGKYELLNVGMYLGSKEEGGKIITNQIINLEQASAWESAGGSDIGYSILHELNESYTSAVLFPGETSDRSYEFSHFLTYLAEGGNQYYPKIKGVYNKETEEVDFFYIDQKNRKKEAFSITNEEYQKLNK